MLDHRKYRKGLGLLFTVLAVNYSCITEIPIETDATAVQDASSTLIVEGYLTDQVQTQEIILSRAADFENDSIVSFDLEDPGTYLFPVQQMQERPVLYETGAIVTIIDDAGLEFQYVEGDSGHYFSAIPFGAQADQGYRLNIRLSDGTQVRSEMEYVTGTAEFTNLTARPVQDPELGEGLRIFATGQSRQGGTPYLKYSFEETFKVIAPYWNPQDFVLRDYNPCADPVTYTLELVNRTQQEQECYRTQASKTILLQSTKGLTSGISKDYPVQFIPTSDFKIAHRYSILVRQQTLSADAYFFFENLKNFSQSDQVFSQIQPGSISGNLKTESGTALEVIGYFYVTSEQEERIFVNFSDVFPGAPEPPYIVPCDLKSSPESHASRCPEFPVQGGTPLCPLSVIELLDLGEIISYAGPFQEDIIALCPGPHAFVPRICGDCTVLGTNEPPAFWIEE